MRVLHAQQDSITQVKEASAMSPSAREHDAVEFGTNMAKWFKSSYSTFNGNCVEVAVLPGDIMAIRDSKNKASGILIFPAGGWGTFIAAVKSHSLDA
jgi:hypothetical protein